MSPGTQNDLIRLALVNLRSCWHGQVLTEHIVASGYTMSERTQKTLIHLGLVSHLKRILRTRNQD